MRPCVSGCDCVKGAQVDACVTTAEGEWRTAVPCLQPSLALLVQLFMFIGVLMNIDSGSGDDFAAGAQLNYFVRFVKGARVDGCLTTAKGEW